MPDAGCDKTPNSAKVAKLVKPTLLLACDFSDRFKDILSENYRISSPAAVQQMEVAAIRFDGVEALVTKGGIKQNQQIIDASPDLGMVAFFGTGFEGIDLAAASARDLVFTHSPGAMLQALRISLWRKFWLRHVRFLQQIASFGTENGSAMRSSACQRLPVSKGQSLEYLDWARLVAKWHSVLPSLRWI
jgi:hypothetical protein